MGKLRFSIGYLLGLFCAAAAAVPAVAGTLSVDVSPTTGYTVTNRTTVALPPKASSGPIATYNPTLGPLTGGGAYQTTSSGITITAIDQTPYKTTMAGRVRAGASAMKSAAGRCFTSARCNLALMAGATGINALFDGLDWVMGEGGRIRKLTELPWDVPNYVPASYKAIGTVRVVGGASWANCRRPTIVHNGVDMVCVSSAGNSARYCQIRQGGYPLISHYWNSCYFGDSSDGPPAKPLFSTSYPSNADIASSIDSNYTPDPSDLPFLTGGIDWSAPDVDFEILDIPAITGADSGTYIENSDGTTTGTYSEFEFSWSGPSKQPTVDVKEEHHEKTYSDTGEPLKSSTTTVISGGSQREPAIPTDCEFMPTVCRFIDWFTEPDPDLNQDVDFSQLIDDVEVDREFSVGSSTAACPAPFVVELSWVPSVEVSLQPFCDLADLLRPVLLAIASLFSGMIVLRT